MTGKEKALVEPGKPSGKAGRPAWEPSEELRKALLAAHGLGMTLAQLAAIADVAESTFYKWLKANGGFSESLKREKAKAGVQAVRTLYQLAMGQHSSQRKAEPNIAALIFWCKAQLKMSDRVTVEDATGAAARRIVVRWGDPPRAQTKAGAKPGKGKA
jgi:transposase-like protein